MDAGGSGGEGYHAAELAVDMHKMRSAGRCALARMGEAGRTRSERAQNAQRHPEDGGLAGGGCEIR
jgi:hypothetical protein